jgi:NTP pyrophosphatase (non-canonical NTP hydrolase)
MIQQSQPNMNFKQYQEAVRKTAIFPNQGDNLSYLTLGLTGEAGEVADKIKKIIRDHEGKLSETNKKELIKELGDVFWYLTMLCWELNVSLEEVANANIKKLQDRKARGVLGGEGDNR